MAARPARGAGPRGADAAPGAGLPRARGRLRGRGDVAHAIDVIAGSPATSLSLMGPNPGLGVRFFGIGNELEAALVAIIVVRHRRRDRRLRAAACRRAAARSPSSPSPCSRPWSSRWGASAPTSARRSCFPIGGAVAAAVVLGGRRWAAARGDCVAAARARRSGGDRPGKRRRRSPDALGARRGWAGRGRRRRGAAAAPLREELRARDHLPLLPLAAAAIALGVRYRRRVLGWLGRPPLQAGFAGTAAAIAAGTLANDSGALVLEVGIAYLLAFAGFAWAQAGRCARRARIEPRAIYYPFLLTCVSPSSRHIRGPTRAASTGTWRRSPRSSSAAATTSRPRALRPARPPQQGPSPRPRRAARAARLPDPGRAHRRHRRQRRDLQPLRLPGGRQRHPARAARGPVRRRPRPRADRADRRLGRGAQHLGPGGRHLPRLLDEAAPEPPRAPCSAPAASSTSSPPGSPSPRPPPGPAAAGSAATTRSSPTASTSMPRPHGPKPPSDRAPHRSSSAAPRSARACRCCSPRSARWSSTSPRG